MAAPIARRRVRVSRFLIVGSRCAVRWSRMMAAPCQCGQFAEAAAGGDRRYGGVWRRLARASGRRRARWVVPVR